MNIINRRPIEELIKKITKQVMIPKASLKIGKKKLTIIANIQLHPMQNATPISGTISVMYINVIGPIDKLNPVIYTTIVNKAQYYDNEKYETAIIAIRVNIIIDSPIISNGFLPSFSIITPVNSVATT